MSSNFNESSDSNIDNCCNSALDEYSWLTENAVSGHLVPLSFKFGLYLGVQLAILYNQKYSILKSGLGRIPIVIQILWLINVVLWSSSFFIRDEDLIFWLPVCSNVFDLSAKILVIYFICIRLIVLAKLQDRLFNISCYLLIILGITFSILGDVPEFIKLSITEETYNFLNTFYPITDAFISFIEIISLFVFVYVKFNCKSMFDVFEIIVNADLIVDFVVVFVSLLVSATLMILKLSMESDIDYDLNFINIVAALKYGSSCNVAVEIFQKTVSNQITMKFQRKSEVAEPHLAPTKSFGVRDANPRKISSFISRDEPA